MTAGTIIGSVLCVVSISGATWLRARSWTWTAALLAGAVGITLLIFEQHRARREMNAAAEAVGARCDETARSLRTHADLVRQHQSGKAIDSKNHDDWRWGSDSGAATALWPLCVDVSCEMPWSAGPNADVMEKLALMLETRSCSPPSAAPAGTR